jgi:isopenicillin N synthase-like dioxygenase
VFPAVVRYYPAKPRDFVAEPGQSKSNCTANHISRIELSERVLSAAVRIGAHADSNGFTVVRLDGQPGLQVRIDGEDGKRAWFDVTPPAQSSDALVVNTGRMIERWTGGFFKAAVHRVVPSTAERLSLAFFSSPNKRARIATVGPAVGADGSYPPILAGELSDAHYLAAYHDGADEVAPNSALRALGEKQLD